MTCLFSVSATQPWEGGGGPTPCQCCQELSSLAAALQAAFAVVTGNQEALDGKLDTVLINQAKINKNVGTAITWLNKIQQAQVVADAKEFNRFAALDAKQVLRFAALLTALKGLGVVNRTLKELCNNPEDPTVAELCEKLGL